MDLNTYSALDELVSWYAAREIRERPKDVGDAFWRPTVLPILMGEIKIIDILSAIERRAHSGGVLVAGSGDGREVAFLAKLGYDVVGIELNPALAKHSKSLMDVLAQEGRVERLRTRIVQGDFLDDYTYHSNGLRFEDFRTIFAYLLDSNFQGLVKKIGQQSPSGTELYALRPVEWEEPRIGLKRIGRYGVAVENTSPDKPVFVPHYNLMRYRKS